MCKDQTTTAPVRLVFLLVSPLYSLMVLQPTTVSNENVIPNGTRKIPFLVLFLATKFLAENEKSGNLEIWKFGMECEKSRNPQISKFLGAGAVGMAQILHLASLELESGMFDLNVVSQIPAFADFIFFAKNAVGRICAKPEKVVFERALAKLQACTGDYRYRVIFDSTSNALCTCFPYNCCIHLNCYNRLKGRFMPLSFGKSTSKSSA